MHRRYGVRLALGAGNRSGGAAMTASQLDVIRTLAVQLLIAHAATQKERNT